MTVDCAGCGQPATEDRPLEWLAEPFLDEVHGEIDMGWWHGDCWSDRKDDV